jgi:hypothetical protein
MTTPPTIEPRDEVWENLKEKLGLNETRTPATKAASAGWASHNILAPCADGQRTNHLVGLAGSYLQAGFSANQTIEHCLLWNERNTPPLDPDKIISTCHSIAATDARNHPHRIHSQVFLQLNAISTPPVPWFDIADARIDGYLLSPPPPMRWVLEGFLPLGIVAAVVAPGGVGKSQLLMQLSYSVATGLKLAEQWTVGETGTVLMLCAEDSTEEIHRRVHRIHQQIGPVITPALRNQLEEHFLIRSITGTNALLTQVGRNNEACRTELTERLLLTAKQVTNLKLIILDPAARFRGGDENSNPHATQFVQALEYLAQSTGATVLIAHHTGKGGLNNKETTQDTSRGASALTDGIRWQLALTTLTNPIKGYKSLHRTTRHLYMEAKLVKTNYTAPQAEVLLMRGEGGYLRAVIEPAFLLSNRNHNQEIALAILRIIQEAPKGITARQLESLHGGIGKDLKISQKALRDAITDARSQELIEGISGKQLQLTAKGVSLLGNSPVKK